MSLYIKMPAALLWAFFGLKAESRHKKQLSYQTKQTNIV